MSSGRLLGHLPSPDIRTAYCAAVGQQLLQRVAPNVLADVEAARLPAAPSRSAAVGTIPVASEVPVDVIARPHC